MGTQVDLVRIFGTIQDPRRTHGQRHGLVDVLTIATLAVICGAE
jgi:hypothetical protein